MSVVAAALRELIGLGVSGEALIAAIERIEQAAVVERAQSVREAVDIASKRADAEMLVQRTKGAERMARYRERRVQNGMSASFDGGRFVPLLRERDGRMCVYCQAAEGNVVDHMWPVSEGGTDHPDNLALSCAACNCGKAGRTLSEEASELRVPTAKAAYGRYVREHVRGVREQAAQCEHDPPPLALSPQTPQSHTPSPGDINTRAKPLFGKSNGFARFWEAYPNKVGKAAAEKSYGRALGKIGGPDPPSVLLAGVERAKASREWREGFIPHPTTWLNQGRWDDEPAEIPQPQARKAPHERPHHDAKFDARQANLARAYAGSERAIGRDWEP